MGATLTKDGELIENGVGNTQICYTKNVTRSGGLWRAENPLANSLPLFVLQLSLIIMIIRIVMLILKPLRQPRIVAEILAGVLLGRSGLASTQFIHSHVFPVKSLMTLETVANLSMVYYMFLVGLETDFTLILRAGKKAYSVVLAGFAVAMPVGYGLFYKLQPKASNHGGAIFWAVALACTNFPDLARILADVKLLRSEFGRTALTSALISDLCCWVFLVVAMALVHQGKYFALGSTIAFTIFCVFALRPALKWIIRHTAKEDNYNDFHVCFVLTGVIACGFIADACGAHSIAGAFMLGVIMPKGDLTDTVIEKVEDFVSGILMPIFFLMVGLRVRIGKITYGTNWANAFLVIVLTFIPKIFSTYCISFLYGMPALDGLSLGLLMNTKGLLSLIILCTGRDLKALDNQTFSVLVLAFWLMTLVVGPILAFTYKRSRRTRHYKCRTIQSTKPDTDFRILVCIHSMRNVSGMINLLQNSNPTQLSPINVFAVHLVELTGRSSAMLIVHDTYSSTNKGRSRSNSDGIASAFESLESHSNNVSVQPLTAVSAYDSMHEDICSLAEDKRVTLIIIPFHKQLSMDGGLEDSNPPLRGVNQNVFANAPCSVAIFVDRGLNASMRRESNHAGHGQRFAMLFIGGPDDREALAYAWRMSGHSSVSLTVVRFVSDEKNAAKLNPRENKEEECNNIEKQQDDDYLEKFRQDTKCNPSVTYMEKLTNNGEETLKTISTMEHHEYDLYIVGRGEGMESPLTSGLTEWSDCPELGALGDSLVSASFTSNVSVLIVQQHGEGSSGGGGEELGQVGVEEEHTGRLKEQFGHMTWQPPPRDNADKEPFVPRAAQYNEDEY